MQALCTRKRGVCGSRRLCEFLCSKRQSFLQLPSLAYARHHLFSGMTAVDRRLVAIDAAVTRTLVKWKAANHCSFLVERGDLILIEELPAAGPGKKRNLRPLSVQESLELLVKFTLHNRTPQSTRG